MVCLHFGTGKTINEGLRQQAMFLGKQNQFSTQPRRHFIHGFEGVVVADRAWRGGCQQFFNRGRTPHGGRDGKISRFPPVFPGCRRATGLPGCGILHLQDLHLKLRRCFRVFCRRIAERIRRPNRDVGRQQGGGEQTRKPRGLGGITGQFHSSRRSDGQGFR